MAVLLSPVYFSPNNSLWLEKNVSSLSVSSLTANLITATSTLTDYIEGAYGEVDEFYVDTKLYVNLQELTADSDQLFLNGIPLATTANLSNIEDWSIYAQVSTIDGNNQNIIGTNLLQANTIGVSTLGVSNATVTTLVGNNATFTNLFTQNLMAFNIVNFTSTVIEVYESTIQSDTKLANISTANICNLNVNTLTVSSIILPPVEEVSTFNVSFLNVGCNANIKLATFSNAPTFTQGATFNGTRPNFNTGINTTGPNNFNNCNIDNASNITGAIINLTVGGQTNITADAGNNILGNPAINLTTQGGGTSAIRIYANPCSPVAFPVPNSSVDIIAEGNVSYIPIAPIPYGGIITMTSRAGGANPLTSPLSMLAGNGAIRLQADSYIPFGSLYPPIPGVVALSGGAILSFSGLTIPTTGPYGCSFYSALTALSLTCGASPALTSFPGTVYLRGDNGTKVLNGLYIDTLYNSIGVDLNITSQSGNWVNIDKAQSIRMSNSGLLDGGGSGSRICNVQNITASNITTPQLNVGNISTSVFSLPQLYTSQINIAPSNTVYISAPDLTINANVVTDENEDPLPNSLNLLASANINITIPNNNAYSINMSGEVYMSKNIYVSCNVVAPRISTNNINVSSINGQPIGGGGSSWVSTATTPLFMSDNYIDLRNNGSNGLSWGSVAPYSVGIDGPYLFGYTQGALGTTSNTNDISLAWDTTEVNIYKTVDMEDNQILNLSSISASGELSITALTDIVITAQSTINTVPISYFTGSISKRLSGVGVVQPIIQYGEETTASGSSGSIQVNLPVAYTASNTYVAFASMEDTSPSEISVVRNSASQIEIYWAQAGGGTHSIAWNTMGN